LQINGKYLIKYALDNLIAMKVDKALIVVGKYEADIKAALGDSYKGIDIRYAVQDTPMGCIHALYCALQYWNGETVVLQLGDEVFRNFDSQAVKHIGDADFACGYITVKNRDDVKENYAIYCDGQSNRLVHCVEKATVVRNNKKGTGFCVFNPSCISLLKKRYEAAGDHFVSLSDYMNNLIASGKKGVALKIASEEININTTEKLQYAKKVLQEWSENE
jgi:dTDP-glucose pyrophosphorylase